MESLQERIAKRAYELFLARGGQHGYHIQDWTQAENEIKEEEQRRLKEKEPAEKVKKAQKAAKKEETVATEVSKPKRSRASGATPAKKKTAKKKAE
ncbi:MAG: DUF2934 domain-containing protein [Fibrobacter sp.]|jgi:hypothetical protein|nr:DUF2934 domain-containing protein [Fibrobacter sp.]